MRTFDFSLFGDRFSVVVPPRAPACRAALRPRASSVNWSALSAAAHRQQLSCGLNVVCDDEGEITYRDEDYAVFDKVKAYDYRD